MGKGKSRKDPNKKQNKIGDWCDCCEIIDGKMCCEAGAPQHIVEEVCKGNPHNCCKVTYRKWAGKDQNKALPHPQSQFKILTKDGYYI